MKKMILNQSIGLFWFMVVYALVRAIIAEPFKIQAAETITVMCGVGALIWLLISYLSYEEKGLGVASSLLPVPIFVYLTWGDFGLMEVKVALMATLLISLITVIISTARVSKEKALPWFSVIIITRTILSIFSLYLVEWYLIPLIPVS